MIEKEEAKEILAQYKRLQSYRPANLIKQTYYEAKRVVKDLGVSIPPGMTGVQESLGWPKTGVDAVAERINFEGWEDERLNKVYDENDLGHVGNLVTRDSLKLGIGFIVVGNGDVEAGEKDIVITVEDPNSMTAHFDLRKRRITSAIKVVELGKGAVFGTYFTENEVIHFIINNGLVYEAADKPRIIHNKGRVPVVAFINQEESGKWKGHSEITEPIISLTNSMMRTLLGAEVSREFYSAPQRYILGADGTMFEDADGNIRDSLSVLMDRVLILPDDGEGNQPTVGQFSSNSPLPYIDLMRFYGQLFSAEACIPENYLGFNTVNPSSADGIRASEGRLIKKSEHRISGYRPSWREVGVLIGLFSSEPMDDLDTEPIFLSPATPTRSAAADEVIKLVGSGILSPDSEIVLRRISLTRKERELARKEATARNATILTRALANGDAAKVGL